MTQNPPPEPSLFELVCRHLGGGGLPPMESIEKWYMLEVLRRMRGNRTHAARALGIGANTLWRKLKRWGVPPARESDAETVVSVTEDTPSVEGHRAAAG